MEIIKASYEILRGPNEEDLKFIEEIGRTCYHSEDKVGPGTAEKFVSGLIKRGHESVIEHVSATVRFYVDRDVTHEIVRHRLAAYTQESARYCSYADFVKFPNGVRFIEPFDIPKKSMSYNSWVSGCEEAEFYYLQLIKEGLKPQQARRLLPGCTATILTMTCNLREWRHVLSLRTSTAAYPQMQEVMIPLAKELQHRIPIIFDDVMEEKE